VVRIPAIFSREYHSSNPGPAAGCHGWHLSRSFLLLPDRGFISEMAIIHTVLPVYLYIYLGFIYEFSVVQTVEQLEGSGCDLT
jgi:hypothetical protein